MNTTSAMDGRALSFTAGVTFNGDVGVLPTPSAPIFTSIFETSTNAVVVLDTTPFSLVTLQSSPSLSRPNWTTIATNTPVASPWAFTDTNESTTERFYRAFLTTP